MLRNGRFAVDRIAASDFKVRRFGMGCCRDRTVERYVRHGQQIWDLRHTQVWAHIDGRWQLTTWQGTPAMIESSPLRRGAYRPRLSRTLSIARRGSMNNVGRPKFGLKRLSVAMASSAVSLSTFSTSNNLSLIHI